LSQPPSLVASFGLQHLQESPQLQSPPQAQLGLVQSLLSIFIVVWSWTIGFVLIMAFIDSLRDILATCFLSTELINGGGDAHYKIIKTP
jgi:hypothetical protein